MDEKSAVATTIVIDFYYILMSLMRACGRANKNVKGLLFFCLCDILKWLTFAANDNEIAVVMAAFHNNKNAQGCCACKSASVNKWNG